ncbi:DUF1905 domain-containing protein [candidate division KSB1 bacterium]|nr:DUF1905 domain-containing protein [candidate division KSB1 bacterium]
MKKFTAVLQDAGGGGVYVDVPFDVEKAYGTRGQVKIKALIDGEPYRGSLANMGTGCHMFPILKAIRMKLGKGPGDKINIELRRDTEERVIAVPADLQKRLTKHKAAKAGFDKLSYSHRKEYVQWIEAAKRAETRASRIEKTIAMLSEGKRSPK